MIIFIMGASGKSIVVVFLRKSIALLVSYQSVLCKVLHITSGQMSTVSQVCNSSN